MKKNKILIIAIILFIFFGVIGLYFYFTNNDITEIVNNINNSLYNQNIGPDNIKNNTITNSSYNTYHLVVGDYLNVVFNDRTKEWKKIDTEEYSEKFETYVDNIYYGKYYLLYGNVWNLLDDHKNFVKYTGNIIAYSSNFNVRVLKYQEMKIDDNILGEIKKYLFKYNYQYEDAYYNRIYYIDENNYVVLCSNILDSENNIGTNYTIGFIKMDGKFYTIFNNEFDAKDNKKYPENMLTGWLIINGKTYLSLKQIHYSLNIPTATLYEFDGSKFEEVI